MAMNQSSVPLIVPLASSRGWKKSERVTEDVAPSKILSGTTGVAANGQQQQQQQQQPHDPGLPDPLTTQSSSRCRVCLEHEARYACPRCGIPYCSAGCYKNHAGVDGKHSCTEGFFESRVTSLVRLESLEQRENAHRTLNRYYHHQQNRGEPPLPPLESEGTATGSHDENENEYDNNGVDTDSLYELWSHLEILEGSNQHLSQNELSKLLPPSLKSVFEKDLQTGKVQADWFLNRWHPWWKRELLLVGNNNDDDENENENLYNNDGKQNGTAWSKKTLDERLLRVPEAAPPPNNKSSKNNNNNNNDDVLACNLLDILYGTCRTLRLYHGAENAARQAPVEAAATLVSLSPVLGKDARFATVSQVLNHHAATTRTSTMAAGAHKYYDDDDDDDDNTAEWRVGMEDVASLVTSPRTVGRALLEASDILKAAIKELKAEDGNNDGNDRSNTTKGSNDENETKTKTKLNQIRRLRKKLQFFLSWAVRRPDTVDLLSGGGLQRDILEWVEERKQTMSEFYHRGEEKRNGCGDNNEIAHVESSLGGNGGIAPNTNTTKLPPFTTPSGGYSSSHNGCGGAPAPDRTIRQPLLVEVQSRRNQ